MPGRLGHEVPDLALSYPVLALTWPGLAAETVGPASACAAAAAAKLLLRDSCSTGVGVTLRPDLAFW